MKRSKTPNKHKRRLYFARHARRVPGAPSSLAESPEPGRRWLALGLLAGLLSAMAACRANRTDGAAGANTRATVSAVAPSPAAVAASAGSSTTGPLSAPQASRDGRLGPATTAKPPEAPVEPALYPLSANVDVFSAPTSVGRPIGTVRPGGFVRLREPAEILRWDSECTDGWFMARPTGYVCANDGATRDAQHRTRHILAEYRLSTTAALPASYGVADETPVYLRIPTAPEQARSEPGLEEHLRPFSREDAGASRLASASRPADERAELDDLGPLGLPVPDDLAKGTLAPYGPKPLVAGSPVTGRLTRGSFVAWVAEFDDGGRGWLLTPDLMFVPRDRVKRSTVSGHHGIEVPEGRGVAFVGVKPEHKYSRDATTGRFAPLRDVWPASAPVLLTQVPPSDPSIEYLETLEPSVYVRAGSVILARPTPPSRWGIGADVRWIEIDQRLQVLLLREGARVLFATLVSLGSTGEIPHQKLRVQSKHLSLATPFDQPRRGLRAEVPEVMLASSNPAASGGYPLFAAFWQPYWGVSNPGTGVSLAPLDARRVFDFTEPKLPDGWHSIRGDGTFVVIRE